MQRSWQEKLLFAAIALGLCLLVIAGMVAALRVQHAPELASRAEASAAVQQTREQSPAASITKSASVASKGDAVPAGSGLQRLDPAGSLNTVQPRRAAGASAITSTHADDDSAPFASMPPDRDGDTLGGLRAGFYKAFHINDNLERRERMRACRRALTFPEQADRYEARLSLNIRARENDLEVVSVEIQDANFADARFEECMSAAMRGHNAVPGAKEGQYFKITYPVLYGAPEK